MIGYKVMRLDPETGRAVSGADGRISLDLTPGAELSMPGQGIWMTLDRDYAERHYAVHDVNAVLEVEFNPADLVEGNLTDRETEFSVPRATLRGVEVVHDEDYVPDAVGDGP